MIYGPKSDGTYVIEFRTAAGEALAISVPVGETRALKHFQERMPFGLFVPDVPEESIFLTCDLNHTAFKRRPLSFACAIRMPASNSRMGCPL
jgi:hypothetical protein